MKSAKYVFIFSKLSSKLRYLAMSDQGFFSAFPVNESGSERRILGGWKSIGLGWPFLVDIYFRTFTLQSLSNA